MCLFFLSTEEFKPILFTFFGLSRVTLNDLLLSDKDFARNIASSESAPFPARSLRILQQLPSIAVKRGEVVAAVKSKHICAPAKYRENMNAESLFCCWAICQPRERAAARGKKLKLSQFAGKAFFHQGFVIGKACDHGVGEHM